MAAPAAAGGRRALPGVRRDGALHQARRRRGRRRRRPGGAAVAPSRSTTQAQPTRSSAAFLTDAAPPFLKWPLAQSPAARPKGDIRLSLFSTAQPLYTRFPNIFSTCFSKVTIGYYPTRPGTRACSPRCWPGWRRTWPCRRGCRAGCRSTGSPSPPPSSSSSTPRCSLSAPTAQHNEYRDYGRAQHATAGGADPRGALDTRGRAAG